MPSSTAIRCPILYCIQPQVVIYVGTSYNSVVTFDGTIDGGTAVNNAGQVAWLMDHFAASATTYQEQGGLQAAIWKTIYPNDYVLDPVANDPGLRRRLQRRSPRRWGATPTRSGNLAWLSNYDGGGNAYQGLVTFSTPCPSPPRWRSDSWESPER